jgi:hypothetical protein
MSTLIDACHGFKTKVSLYFFTAVTFEAMTLKNRLDVFYKIHRLSGRNFGKKTNRKDEIANDFHFERCRP